MSTVALRRPVGATSRDSADRRDRSVRRRVGLAWALLFFNTLTFVSGPILYIPTYIGKGLAQGSLPLALLVAVTVNPKVRLRPNIFLCLVCLLVLDTVITCMTAPHPGTVFRTVRLAEFVTALWLLTPWWGRHDMLLLRLHLRCLFVVLANVTLGLMIAPGQAIFDGRLSGVIWPMGPTQTAQYAAVTAGILVLLWLARLLRGHVTLVGVAIALYLLILTHTRTALLALVAGLVVAGLSLVTTNARVRKFFAAGVAVVSIGVVTVAGVVTTWLARGENKQGIATLTGRTNFWTLVLNTPRTGFQEIFGFGLSNASVNGLPIDSNWLAAYMQEGLYGVVVCVTIVAFLFVTSFFQPPGIRRALGLFLVTYCLLASFTEDSFSNASTYLLHLTVAASLLIAPLVPRIFVRRPPGFPVRKGG